MNVELVIPLTNWLHYEDTLEHYQEYHRVPTNTLVHIYPEEQHAFRLEGLIAQKIDRTFAGQILDPSVTALVGDFALFETFALILTEGLLPVAGGGLGDPPRYTLSLPNGEVNLGEVWDIDTVVSSIWRDAEVQQRLAAVWQEREREVQTHGQIKEFLAGLEDKARTLTLPAPPTGSVVRTDVEHLRLAVRAVVGEYVARGRR